MRQGDEVSPPLRTSLQRTQGEVQGFSIPLGDRTFTNIANRRKHTTPRALRATSSEFSPESSHVL